MGLLDDAIKEHLELKRKHGAAEDDVRRQEGEALGPARRDFTPESASAEPAVPAAEEAPPVASGNASSDSATAAEPAGWLDDEPGGAPFEAEQPAAAEPATPDPVPTPEPVARADEPPARSQTPTEGFDALSLDDDPPAAPEPAAPGEEDVLEETPEFLQDTPEHDRLWFEQKPPRDFDFDD
jgi:hypothetical protein